VSPGAVTPGVCIRGPSVPAFRIQSIAVCQFLDFALQCVLLLCSMLQFKGEKELLPCMISGIRYPSCFGAPIPLYSPWCVYSVQKKLEGTRTCHAPRWPSLACVTVVCECSVNETIVMVDLFVCGHQDGSAETAFGNM